MKPAYLDKDRTAEYVSLSPRVIDVLVAKGAFPGPRQLSDRRVGWLVREVDEWAESRPASSMLPVANCGRNQ